MLNLDLILHAEDAHTYRNGSLAPVVVIANASDEHIFTVPAGREGELAAAMRREAHAFELAAQEGRLSAQFDRTDAFHITERLRRVAGRLDAAAERLTSAA